MTEYEQRFSEQGMPIYRLEATYLVGKTTEKKKANRGREISSEFVKNELVGVRGYVRVYFRKKCTGKPYIEDRLACCFLQL